MTKQPKQRHEVVNIETILPGDYIQGLGSVEEVMFSNHEFGGLGNFKKVTLFFASGDTRYWIFDSDMPTMVTRIVPETTPGDTEDNKTTGDKPLLLEREEIVLLLCLLDFELEKTSHYKSSMGISGNTGATTYWGKRHKMCKALKRKLYEAYPEPPDLS